MINKPDNIVREGLIKLESIITVNKNGIEAYISIILRPYKSSFPPKYPRVAPIIIPIK